MSSEKKDPSKEYGTYFDVALMKSRGTNYEQMYNDLKTRYEELEEVHQSIIEETQMAVSEAFGSGIYKLKIAEGI